MKVAHPAPRGGDQRYYTLSDEAFGYLKRVIVTPAVYPRLVKAEITCSKNVYTFSTSSVLIRDSRIPRVRVSSNPEFMWTHGYLHN
uniref:Uncharacterized protein n=1 Tax=Panagrolaimus sp. JU765 TaxID=591449 RepID=A0AC34RJZ8_9BILA